MPLPPDMPEVERVNYIDTYFRDWRQVLDEAHGVPTILIGMGVAGEHNCTPILLFAGVKPERVQDILVRILEYLRVEIAEGRFPG